jgi:hypothetical protein
MVKVDYLSKPGMKFPKLRALFSLLKKSIFQDNIQSNFQQFPATIACLDLLVDMA